MITKGSILIKIQQLTCSKINHKYVLHNSLKNDESEQYMSLVFSDFWGSFAHTGIPNSQNTENWIKYKNLDKVT